MAYILFNPPKGTRKGSRVRVGGIGSVLVEQMVNRGGVRFALVDTPVPALFFSQRDEESK